MACQNSAEGGKAFFYGTLMVPAVLHRVCPGSTFTIPIPPNTHLLRATPAILPKHRRHRVKHADYPAVVPATSSTVRGTFVSGLTTQDLARLDLFEGSEYSREAVKVKLLKAVGDESGERNVEGEEVDAETYIWIAGQDSLQDGEWDFTEFQKEKLRYWVGEEGEGEYAGKW